MYNPEEEELTAGQQHAVRGGVIVAGGHSLTVLVPGDDGGGVALRLTVQGGRVILHHKLVLRVLHDTRVRHLGGNN